MTIEDQIEAESAGTRRIVLTGFMGSGKSTVGPLLARRLGWRFVDVDDVIEAEAGTAIAELFRTHGEAHFRGIEHATIARLAAFPFAVIYLLVYAGSAHARRTLRRAFQS